MDSQLTLVDASSPFPSDGTLVLIFDRDDMTNTTLRARGACMPSYSVDTLDNRTAVYAGDYLLATVTRNRFRRDQITFPGSSPMKLASWLKEPKLSTFPLVFSVCGRQLEWRADLAGQLVLHELGHSGAALAWFTNSCRHLGGSLMDAAYLAVKPEIIEIRDMIVLSCLLVEHKRRQVTAVEHAGMSILDTIVTF